MEEYIMKNNSTFIQRYNFDTLKTSSQGEQEVAKLLLLEEETRSNKVKKFSLDVISIEIFL